eukprot:c40863_g1_i1 orf=266-1237(+)
MGGEEESSGLGVVVADEKAPPSSQTSLDPSVQQRWSELETIHLIAAYQEKWYLLKRGQLKARHWEEVANNVFLRGGSSEPSKSSVQCRHKVEKLRKKYREEKQLEEQRGPGSSTWPYFEHMDAMEHGRTINKVTPSAPFASASAACNGNTTINTRYRSRWQERGDRDHEPRMSVNNDMHDTSPPPIPRMRGSVRVKGGPIRHAEHVHVESPRVTLRPKLRKNYSLDEAYVNMDDKATIPDISNDLFSKRMKTELASVVRSLGEGFLRIEQMKLEMQRDNERLRAEVELKRMGMLLDSQKQIAEMFTKAITGKKSVKKRQLQEL